MLRLTTAFFVIYLSLLMLPARAEEKITQATLQEVARLVNEKLPKPVGIPDGHSDAELQRVRADPGLSLVHEVTLTKTRVTNYKASSYRDFSAELSRIMPTAVCRWANFKGLLSGGVSIGYEYRDANKVLLGSVLIRSTQCNQAK